MEFDIYRLADLISAEGEIRNNPSAAPFTVRINAVESLHVADNMLHRAESVRDDLDAHVTNLDPLRLLVRTDELIADITLYLLPELADLDGGDPPINSLLAYVERLSNGVPTRGIFPAFAHAFTTRVTNAVHSFQDEALTRPQLILELQRALTAFNHSSRTEYLPIP